MKKPTRAPRGEVISLGAHAQSLLSQLSPFLKAQEEAIVSSMVLAYKSGSIDYDTLVGSVGEIAALRKLKDKLETQVQAGRAASERIFRDGQEAED